MAEKLYTLKSIDDIINPLRGYGGDSGFIKNQMVSFGLAPSREQTQIYDTIGRGTARDQVKPISNPEDNWVVKKAKSVENAIGSTLAAPVSLLADSAQNKRTADLLKSGKQSLEDIYKKYGYDNSDAYYDAKNATENEVFNKYGFNSDDFWNKRADADLKGDKNTVAALENERQQVIGRMSEDDANRINYFDNIQNELKGQSSKNMETMKKNQQDYKNYLENDYFAKKIKNQDQGQFAGSAINTLSTMADILAPGASIALNAAQGGVEGIADELERGGFKDFNWDNAKTNALAGVAGGAAAGALNKGISANLAKKGGNLFKGGNKLTQGLNNLGANTAAGRTLSTLATGAGRGAMAGAAGGAAGGATVAALNDQDVLAGALEGAGQGLTSGAVTGGAMAGVNMAARGAMNKINDFRAEPDNGFGKRYNQFAGDGNKAIDYLVKRGGGEVEGAVKSPAVEAITGDGNIDLVYGKTGANGYGLAHIIEKHGLEVANKLPDILENGKAYRQDGINDRLYVKKDNDNSVVRLDWDGNKKQWVATAYGEDNPVSRDARVSNVSDAEMSPASTASDTPISNSVPRNEQNVNEVYITSAFNSNIAPIQNRNKLQALGDYLQNTAETQKFSDVFDSLDAGTARRAAETRAPQKLAELGIGSEDYGEAAKTSSYVNEVVSKLAKDSKVKVNVPDLQDRLSAGGLGIPFDSDANQKTYSSIIRNIVPDGDSPTQYSASYLLEKSRELGKKAASLKTSTNAGRELRNALTEAKYELRNLATDALSKAGVTGDLTTDNLVAGLKKLGANEKVRDYYAAPSADGGAPTAKDFISRSALFEQARDMDTQIKGERYTRSASKLQGNPLTRMLEASGLERPINAVLKKTVAPAASGITKVAGKTIGKVGDIAANIRSPQTEIYNRLMGGAQPDSNATTITTGDVGSTRLYDVLGREEGLNQAEQERTANYLTDAVNTQNDNTANTAIYNMAYGTPTAQASNNSVAPVQATAGSPFGQTGDYWTDILGNAMYAAAQADDIPAFAALYGMYQDSLAKLDKSSGNASGKTTADLTAGQQDNIVKLKTANSALDELETLLANAGGGQGPIMGNLLSMFGDWGWNSDVATYNELSRGLINQIAAAVGKTDALNTEGEVQRALGLVPQITDDSQTAKNKLAELRRMLASTEDIYSSVYGV